MIEKIAAIAGAAWLGYSAFIERNAISLTRLDLAFSKLPKSFDGFTILQLSDMHTSHWWAIERRMEQLVAPLNVDLLALTGDMAVSSRGARLLKEFLGRIRPDRETYAVFGNTEHKGRYGLRRRADLTWHGLHILTNEHVIIERGGERIVLAGVDDPFTRRDDVARALEGAPSDAFKLLLAHAADAAGDAVRAGVDLMLSGHTHGGQIVIPLIGVLYPHLRRHRTLVRGLFEGRELSRILKQDAKEMRLYVSRGIGISNLPLRFLSPPEIVFITLRSTP